jgi:hypothetical protein
MIYILFIFVLLKKTDKSTIQYRKAPPQVELFIYYGQSNTIIFRGVNTLQPAHYTAAIWSGRATEAKDF